MSKVIDLIPEELRPQLIQEVKDLIKAKESISSANIEQTIKEWAAKDKTKHKN